MQSKQLDESRRSFRMPSLDRHWRKGRASPPSLLHELAVQVLQQCRVRGPRALLNDPTASCLPESPTKHRVIGQTAQSPREVVGILRLTNQTGEAVPDDFA